MFSKWDKKRPDGRKHYDVQSEIVRKALEENSLDKLMELMRKDGEESSIYLSGTRIDNGSCFGSDDLGIVISVLPQDGKKASVPGYHPGSTEIYILIQGDFVFEFLSNGTVKKENLYQYYVRIIPPGECHRVRLNKNCTASSLIIKTNLKHKPGVVRCDECGYYRNAEFCPLNRSWKEES